MSKAPKRQGRKKPAIAPSSTNRIPNILLLVETSHSYGRGVIEGVALYAKDSGPWNIRFEQRGFDSLPPDWLMEWKGDGIIARTVKREQAELLWSTKVPMVELYGDPEYGMGQVQCDDAAMGRMAAEHFLSRGLKNFGYFTFAETWWIEPQRKGFRDALDDLGFVCHSYNAPPSTDRIRTFWQESSRPRVIEWLQSLPRPIGIYTAGDPHSARLLDICSSIGLGVPEQVAILGTDNDTVICESIRPTLSSIDLDPKRIGYEAAKLLDGMMAGKKSPKEVAYFPPSHVVVRQSTDLMLIEDIDVLQALQFIRDFACKGIDVDRVAEEVGLSRSVLQRRFRKHLGRTPKEEILRNQITHAKSLLEISDKIGESIAHKCGFSSHKYFSKAFRREVGITPQAYRSLRRISNDADAAPM